MRVGRQVVSCVAVRSVLRSASDKASAKSSGTAARAKGYNSNVAIKKAGTENPLMLERLAPSLGSLNLTSGAQPSRWMCVDALYTHVLLCLVNYPD